MEFQTNKETGTQSSNGKYNYAAKFALRYVDRSFFNSERDLTRFLKDWECECVVSVRGCIYCFKKMSKKNDEV